LIHHLGPIVYDCKTTTNSSISEITQRPTQSIFEHFAGAPQRTRDGPTRALRRSDILTPTVSSSIGTGERSSELPIKSALGNFATYPPSITSTSSYTSPSTLQQQDPLSQKLLQAVTPPKSTQATVFFPSLQTSSTRNIGPRDSTSTHLLHLTVPNVFASRNPLSP